MDCEFLDMLWIDFGAGNRLDEFFSKWWPKLRKGGHALVHSTVTNEFTRKWLECMRAKEGRPLQGSDEEEEEEYHIPHNLILGPEDSDSSGDEDRPTSQPSLSSVPTKRQRSDASMEYETLSFFEPHKMFQNSFSIFQKRGEYSEPVLTKYP